MSNNTLNMILTSDRPALFTTLLKKGGIDYEEIVYYLLQNSSITVAKNVDIVKYLYAKLNFNKTNKQKLLSEASKFDLVELVRLILDEMKNGSNIRILLSDTFSDAIRKGSVNVIKMMLTDQRINPGGGNSWAIQVASQNGYVEVVKLLLADTNIDPSTKNNYAIRWASKFGHYKVVKLLLAVSNRVDPSAEDNYAIQLASANGHFKTVKLLLADLSKRVDPSACGNIAIQLASQNGHVKVVKLLLADPRVDPSAGDNWAIRKASEYGHTKVVKLLSCYSKELNIEMLVIIVKAWLVHQ